MSRTKPQHGLRRSGLLRWPVVCVAVLVASCQPAGILDPQGRLAAPSALDDGGPQPRGGTAVAASDESSRPGDLLGTWRKITTSECAEKYPATISFSSGTYRGARGPGQGMVWWDAGIYRLEDPRRLVLSVATDELVTYDITVRGDQFDVIDADGCRLSYRREPAHG
jgi:hypothetical protein